MSFKQPLFESLSANQKTSEKPQRQARNSSKSGLCRVCNDKANIINYGALSCQSCKVFFRRNGFRPRVCSQTRVCLILLFTILLIECSSMLFQQRMYSKYASTPKLRIVSFSKMSVNGYESRFDS